MSPGFDSWLSHFVCDIEEVRSVFLNFSVFSCTMGIMINLPKEGLKINMR